MHTNDAACHSTVVVCIFILNISCAQACISALCKQVEQQSDDETVSKAQHDLLIKPWLCVKAREKGQAFFFLFMFRLH